MLINTTPRQGGVNFVSRSPMSVGVWALSLFALVSFVTFVATLSEVRGGRGAAVRLMAGRGGSLVGLAGALLGLFVASYPGGLRGVRYQPVRRGPWTLGRRF